MREEKKISWNFPRNHSISESVGHSKGVQRGKFIAISAYIKNTERSQVHDL
jgi:hypothetical protein